MIRPEVERLRDALQMIAEGSLVPEAFPQIWDTLSQAEQEAMSARLIALAALEGGDQPTEGRQ